MNPFRWIKSKLAEVDRRLNDWVDRTAPERDRKSAELKEMIREREERLRQQKR